MKVALAPQRVVGMGVLTILQGLAPRLSVEKSISQSGWLVPDSHQLSTSGSSELRMARCLSEDASLWTKEKTIRSSCGAAAATITISSVWVFCNNLAAARLFRSSYL